MFFHPVFLFFFFLVILSVIMMISVNSWFIVWLIMEMNLLCFIPMIYQKKNKYSVESTLKYFFIQTLMSVVLIIAVIYMYYNLNFMSVICLSLLGKSGAAPFHQWVPSMVEGVSWFSSFILLTVQKIGPLILISLVFSDYNMYSIIFFFIICSSVIGSVGGINQSSLRKIMVFSSIAHMAWLLSIISVSSLLWVYYLLIYSLILLSLVIMFFYYNLNSLNQLVLKLKFEVLMVCSFSMMSLSGLPPFSGFLLKLMVLSELVLNSNLFIVLVLLTGTFISLFFYSRMIFNSLFLVSLKNKSKINLIFFDLSFIFFNLFNLLISVMCLLF